MVWIESVVILGVFSFCLGFAGFFGLCKICLYARPSDLASLGCISSVYLS